jgi:hypothetical protein
MKFDGTHQLLAYADDVILLGDNTETINRHRNFNQGLYGDLSRNKH